jgi:hypothetical protein
MVIYQEFEGKNHNFEKLNTRIQRKNYYLEFLKSKI